MGTGFITNAISKMSTTGGIIGASVFIVVLLIIGFKFMFGKHAREDAKSHAPAAIFGLAIIVFAVQIAALIKSWFV